MLTNGQMRSKLPYVMRKGKYKESVNARRKVRIIASSGQKCCVWSLRQIDGGAPVPVWL